MPIPYSYIANTLLKDQKQEFRRNTILSHRTVETDSIITDQMSSDNDDESGDFDDRFP